MFKIIHEIENFFRRIRYFGFASPQFLLKENKLYLTEINPRLSAVPFGTDFDINFPEAFHEAIVERKNIEKKFIFMPKNFSWRNWILHFMIYRKKYRDYLPLLIWLCQYFKVMTREAIKFIFSSQYRKWRKIFESIRSDVK
jgi:hypothetical protein